MSISAGVKQLDRRKNISLSEFISEYAQPKIPVILEGAANNWIAMKKWDFEYFITNFGNKKAEVAWLPTDENSKFTYIKMKISDYFNYLSDVQDTRLLYLKDLQLLPFSHLSKVTKDFVIPEYFNNDASIPCLLEVFLRWFYIGKKGTYSLLHLDVLNTTAWNATITGNKFWVFYPPDNKIPKEHAGLIDVFEPDYEQYPFFGIDRYEGISNPGDIVYTPSLWLHGVKNLSTSISITQNYVDRFNLDTVKKSMKKDLNFATYLLHMLSLTLSDWFYRNKNTR